MCSSYFPAFLYFSFGTWIALLIVFVVACIYIKKLPDDKILDYKARAIENKRKMGIKVYKF